MARSPIEMAIDRACGVTAEDLARPAPKRRDVDADTQAILDLGNAAAAWVKLRDNSTPDRYIEAERVLVEAARALVALGW